MKIPKYPMGDVKHIAVEVVDKKWAKEYNLISYLISKIRRLIK
ncbi:MAG: hypothetical protein ACRC6X_02955 [Culicoidibacterales bacterium]